MTAVKRTHLMVLRETPLRRVERAFEQALATAPLHARGLSWHRHQAVERAFRCKLDDLVIEGVIRSWHVRITGGLVMGIVTTFLVEGGCIVARFTLD
jgi:hypothetical protein